MNAFGNLAAGGLELLLKDNWDRAFRAAEQNHAKMLRTYGTDVREYALRTLENIAACRALVYFVNPPQDLAMSRADDLRAMEKDARKALKLR